MMDSDGLPDPVTAKPSTCSPEAAIESSATIPVMRRPAQGFPSLPKVDPFAGVTGTAATVPPLANEFGNSGGSNSVG